MASYTFTPAEAKTAYDALETATAAYEAATYSPKVFLMAAKFLARARWWDEEGKNLMTLPESVTFSMPAPYPEKLIGRVLCVAQEYVACVYDNGGVPTTGKVTLESP